MPLLRFNVLNNMDDHQSEGIDYPMLINTDHIASIKLINIMYKGNIIRGFWVRLVNGKRYKATRIPASLAASLGEGKDLTDLSLNEGLGSAGEQSFSTQ